MRVSGTPDSLATQKEDILRLINLVQVKIISTPAFSPQGSIQLPPQNKLRVVLSTYKDSPINSDNPLLER